MPHTLNALNPSRHNQAQSDNRQSTAAIEQGSPALSVYQLKQPEWRLPIQINRPELGYPGLHPTHPGQHEDAITKSLVQWGFSAQMLVSTESFSAHQMIYKKITDEAGFNVSSSALSALIEARRRYCALSSYDTESTIKVPGRVTLNEQKRENWLRELADNSVPLLKLSKNVPHGFKGEKLLEMLVTRKIDSSRATWYIRLIGLNEINAQRNKNELSHIRYTLSFTSDVCQFLYKQLSEVTVPLQMNLSSSTTSLITTSTRLAAMNVRSKPRSSTLSDPETRKHWVAKWNQSRMLLKRLSFESLLDQPTFFKWLIDQLKTANLAQINFLLEIHHSVLDRFNLSSNLVRGFVEACLAQIRFINKQTGTLYLSKLERRLKLAVQSAFIFSPDNFVWPDLWISNKVLLKDIILANSSLSADTHQLREMLKGDFYAVNWRVSELIGEVGTGTGIVGNIFTRRAQLVEVTQAKRKILDSYTDYNDCSKLYYKYFLNPSVAGHIPVSFKDKLEVLLSWATTFLRASDKRVHLVANTLSHVKHDYKNGDEFQNILIGWLEQIESIEGGDLLVRLFSELSRRNIFSYGAYVQRMVAKGDTECDMVAGKASGLQALLSEWMPLASSKASRERSSSIKRSPGRDSPRNGLMAIIADFNSAIASADYGRFASLLKRRLDVRQPSSANRKLLAEILPNALVNLVSELAFPNLSGSSFLVNKAPNHPQMASALLTWAIQLLEACQAHATLFEIINRIVQIDLSRLEALRSDERACADLGLSFQSNLYYLQVICMTASNHKEILEINGQVADLISRLFAIYVHFRRLIGGTFPVVRGFVRCLRNLVIESNAVDGQILEVLDKEYHTVSDEMMAGPSTGEALPSRTREIVQLIQSPSTGQVSQLVLKYWEEYRSDMDWGPVLWNSLIAALKIHSQEEFDEPLSTNSGDRVQVTCENWAHFRETIVQFCEDLDVLYEEGLIGCLIRSGYTNYPHADDEELFSQPAHRSGTKMTSEEEEGEESEEITAEAPSLKSLFFHNPRSLCRNIRRLLIELMSCGLISIEVGLEEYAIRPLADDIPQLLVNLCGDGNSGFTRVPQTIQAEEALRQVKEIHALVNEALCEQHIDRCYLILHSLDKECAVMMTPSQSRSEGHPSFTTQATPEVSFKSKDIVHAIEEYVRAWKLNVERKLWFEQSDEGSAFCSRLLLSLLISIKTVSELSFDPAPENPTGQQQESFEQLITKILDVFENLRCTVCQGSILLRRQIPAHSAVFLNPILEFVTKNDLGTIFHTKLIHSIDELLPYSQPTDLVNQKYPYLESIFKATCIFNHAARTRQFQLHIRLLMSNNPPQVSSNKDAPLDLASTLGSLVEVMAKRLHLTHSKDASPFFLECLPEQVAEALIIKLSLYLGMSICKLLGPNNTDSALELLRIHHISRCITTLTNQLTMRTYHPNDDAMIMVVGGCGPLGCNATVESYMSYWQQLKSGLSLLSTRVTTSESSTPNPRRMEYRMIRALLHSVQVVLWSLPGLTQHLGTLKQMIAEIWIEIALRVQGDSALQNQIMDTISILLFPTVPDDSCLTATVGMLRKRFRWLYLPILNLDDGANLVPSNRLKYLLGSSLRGSSTIFQERVGDGAVKFVEEKPWEELEKMDLCGPGFISINALKCQTLSHVEQIPDPKRLVSRQPKSKRGAAEGEEAIAEEIEPGGERGSDKQMGGAHELEEEALIRGERHCFEHELITDGLSTMPLHFLRSLFPPASRLSGEDWLVAQEQQKLQQAQQVEQTRLLQQQASMEASGEQESSRSKKRKGLGLSPLAVEQSSSSSTGPTLRSARSTRKKSSATAPINLPTTSGSKRAKKR